MPLQQSLLRTALLATTAAGAGACVTCPVSAGAVCCNPHLNPAQLCPGGNACCDCGSDACLCPGQPTPAPTPEPARTPAPCVPQCADKECGPDSCGHSCPWTCPDNSWGCEYSSGRCKPPAYPVTLAPAAVYSSYSDNGWIHSSGPCTDPACNCSCILNDTLPAGPTWYQDKADTWTRKIYAVFDAPHRGTPGTVHPAAAWPPLVENSAVYVAFNWTSKGGGAHGTADRIFVDTASCISATSPPRSNPCPAGETPTSKFGNAVPANASSAWVKVDGFPIIIGFEANPVGWGSTSYTIDSLSLQYTPVLATPAPPPSTPAPPMPTACPSVYTNDRSGTCYLHHATCGPLCDASHVRINANLTCPMYCPRCDCSACSSCPPPRGGTDCMTCLGGANCTVDNVMGCGCGHC